MRLEAVIKIKVEAWDQAEALDAISEALRPLLRTYTPQSSIIDWLYVSLPQEPLYPQEYEYE